MSQSPDLIRRAVQDAERRRRRQSVTRALTRLAPAMAGALLLIAILLRLLARPPVWLWVGLAAGAAGLALYGWIARRITAPTDATAARIDREAGLAGELRSAHWFADRPAGDDWETFHVDRAAARIASVDWAGLYPPVRAARAWIATGALVAGAIALALIPSRFGLILKPPAALAAQGGAADDGSKILLSEELRKQLEALLSKMEKGEISLDAARGQVANLRDLLARLEASQKDGPTPTSQPAALALGKQQTPGGTKDDKDLAERIERAANSPQGMPQDLKQSLEDMAARLSKSSANEAGAEKNASSSGEPGKSSDQAATGAPAGASSMQMAREAAADPGAAQMMMSGGGAMGGDSRPGAGNQGRGANAGQMLNIENALRREVVEASTDTTGSNVTAEIRRKTEQGKSTLGFTRVAAPATFDRSRAVAPPPVPDARRALLQQYFIRR